MTVDIGLTENDLLFARVNSAEYQDKLAEVQADLVQRRKQREIELEKELEELEAESEAEHVRHLKKPDRNASIMATPQELAEAERRYKKMHPEPVTLPMLTESDRLMRPIDWEMMSRPVMDPERADRIRANEAVSDLPPSQALEHLNALEHANAFKATGPRNEQERFAMSQKSVSQTYPAHGWTEGADAETRRLRSTYTEK